MAEGTDSAVIRFRAPLTAERGFFVLKETLINSPAPRRAFRRLAASKLIHIAPLCLFASPCQTTKFLDSASGSFNQCLLKNQFCLAKFSSSM